MYSHANRFRFCLELYYFMRNVLAISYSKTQFELEKKAFLDD